MLLHYSISYYYSLAKSRLYTTVMLTLFLLFLFVFYTHTLFVSVGFWGFFTNIRLLFRKAHMCNFLTSVYCLTLDAACRSVRTLEEETPQTNPHEKKS